MKLTSKSKHLHMSPQKCRLVVDLIRGLDVEKGEMQLKNLRKKASLPILKLLNSAVATAEHNYSMEKSNLYISKVFVDGGAVLKRWKPRAFGRANPIIKRTSHVTLVLDERVAGKKKAKSIVKDKKTITQTNLKNEKDDKDNKDNRNDKKKNKFDINNKRNTKPSRNGGVLKKIFRRKSV